MCRPGSLLNHAALSADPAVVMVQGSDGNASQPGEFLYAVPSRVRHNPIVNADAASEASLFFVDPNRAKKTGIHTPEKYP